MEHVVMGLDEEVTARAGVRWIIERARAKPINLRLVAELHEDGSNPGSAKKTLASATLRIQEAAPGSDVEFALADRPLLHELLERSESADLIVVGWHPDPAIRDGRVPSLPVSLAARSKCPVVIVPDDWEHQDGPIVIGIETDGEASAAVAFAGREATETNRELRLVHTWESWNALDARAAHIEHGEVLRATAERLHTEFPGIHLGVVLEEAVAHDGVIANSRDAHLVVLGTHRIGRETGLVLGGIHQEVMLRGSVPLCVVPLD